MADGGCDNSGSNAGATEGFQVLEEKSLVECPEIILGHTEQFRNITIEIP